MQESIPPIKTSKLKKLFSMLSEKSYVTATINKCLIKREKQNIILALREIMETKVVRASPHFFNSENEIMSVVDAIKKL